MQTNPEIPTDEFYRIKLLPPYVFSEVNKLKAELRAQGQDIIDFGFGNPDLPTPQHVINKLIETVQKPRITGYCLARHQRLTSGLFSLLRQPIWGGA